MVYKKEYAPFNILCPVTYNYVPYEDIKYIIEGKNKYKVFKLNVII